MASAEATSPAPNMSPGELECMRERKWWCFLLSSIFTFLAGLFIILIWRALAFLCCRKEKAGAYSPGAPKQPTAKKAAPGAADAKRKGGEGAAEIGFMTEAKDWAGELISGQTTTGRILPAKSRSIRAGQWPAPVRGGGQAKGAPRDSEDASHGFRRRRSHACAVPCCCCGESRLGFCPAPQSAAAVAVAVKVQLCGDTLGPAARAACGCTEISVAPGSVPKRARAAGKLEW
ncbi:hypothetical protein HPB49_011332 [Dermacentor silvarum]|uniref:Uncharacterized protein n=1 Tax=Dermacentor silvarum TaxID=543639 RepID=A0ACB8DYW1_DERSI|nr:hypothetical protein HPB49_011332 [Dermacentor silvarum]